MLMHRIGFDSLTKSMIPSTNVVPTAPSTTPMDRSDYGTGFKLVPTGRALPDPQPTEGIFCGMVIYIERIEAKKSETIRLIDRIRVCPPLIITSTNQVNIDAFSSLGERRNHHFQTSYRRHTYPAAYTYHLRIGLYISQDNNSHCSKRLSTKQRPGFSAMQSCGELC
jgi:hypothetical protein